MRDLFNYRFVLERSRSVWIDYARGICIILVCYRHSFEGLINANFPTDHYPVLTLLNSSLVTFRMALFFIISGSFLSRTLEKKSYSNYIVDRFKVILYPLFIWGAVQITLQLVFSNFTNGKREWVDYFYLIVMPRKIEQFWFLNTLFMVGIVYAFLKSVLRFNIWHLMLTALLFYTLGGLFYSTNANMKYETLAYSFIPDLLHYFIFFFIGDAVTGYLHNAGRRENLITPAKLAGVFIFFLVAHAYYTMVNAHYNKGYFVEFYMPASFLFIALSGCALVIQLAILLEKYKALPFLRVLGYHSLFIYLMHVIITGSTRVLVKHLLHTENVPLVLFLSIINGVLIPVIAYTILTRNGFWWLFTLKKPSDEINYYKNQVPAINMKSIKTQ
jgi:fucose 4-O-acetylase-like acetyltransferase